MSAHINEQRSTEGHMKPHAAAPHNTNLGHFHVSVQEEEPPLKSDNLYLNRVCRYMHTLPKKLPESHAHTALFGTLKPR